VCRKRWCHATVEMRKQGEGCREREDVRRATVRAMHTRIHHTHSQRQQQNVRPHKRSCEDGDNEYTRNPYIINDTFSIIYYFSPFSVAPSLIGSYRAM
jgi:hypothetical protein